MSKYKNASFTGKKHYRQQVKWTDKQNPGYHWQGREDDLEFNAKKIKNKQSSFRKAVMRRHLKQRENYLNSIILALHTLNNTDFNIPDNKFEIIEIIPYTLYRWYATSYEFRLEYITLEKRNIFVRHRQDYKSNDKYGTYGTYGAFGYDDFSYLSSRGGGGYGYYTRHHDEDYIHLGAYDRFTNISKIEIIEGTLALLKTFFKYCNVNKPVSDFDELIS